MLLPASCIIAPSDLRQAKNNVLDLTLTLSSRSHVNLRHLLTSDSRRRVSTCHKADTSLRAVISKDTPATDSAMTATPKTCDKCQ
jgi:hypothetical protein